MFLGSRNDRSGKVDSIIGTEAEIKGHIISRATIRIDGKVEGDIDSQGDIIVGKEGKIKGDLKAKNIIMSGRVVGNIHSEERTELLEGGQLVGDMKAATVVIAEGGMFEGHCEMQKDKPKIVEIPEKESRAGMRSRASE